MQKNFSRVYSAQPFQLEGQIVSVEIDITGGLHAFHIVGLPNKAVEEARDRVASAIKNSGFISPKQENYKTVVSLAPAELKKQGSYFDLAIAVGYLLSTENIAFEPSGKLFIGELSLNGELQSVTGILPIVQAAKKNGFAEIFVPYNNREEAALIEGIIIYPAKTLDEVLCHVHDHTIVRKKKHWTALERKPRILPSIKIEAQPKTIIIFKQKEADVPFNLSQIKGQETAKRGLEIAAAGGHNVIMSGPPGTGKTLLARAFAGLLPALSEEEVLEITGIHSIAGILQEPLVTMPPFRSPHHTASYPSIVGGGTFPKPGEITLAHRGVLFMDELPEFDSRVLESLRQPLEDHSITISRAKGTALFPAQFTLIATMNPCPCGNYGADFKKCTCTPAILAHYRRRISGPIMDRIDLWMTVEHIEYEKLSELQVSGDSINTIRSRVSQARARQKLRFGTSTVLNAHMTVQDLEKIFLSPNVRKLLNKSAQKLFLSPR